MRIVERVEGRFMLSQWMFMVNPLCVTLKFLKSMGYLPIISLWLHWVAPVSPCEIDSRPHRTPVL